MPLFKSQKPPSPSGLRNIAAEHNARVRAVRQDEVIPTAQPPEEGIAVPTAETVSSSPRPASRILRPRTQGEPAPEPNPLWKKFQGIMQASRRKSGTKVPRKYLVRTAAWDLSAIISLLVNAVLLGVILLLAFRVSTLQNTLNGLLGGLYDNFVRMDRSYITTTIQVQDMPIPLDFSLPVVQDQTNVTLTQAVTVRNAYVVIDTGELNISAPATVTLPAGTTLPVSLNMQVPVQTTVLVDLLVPVNIELATARSSDPSIANLHTAFLGLQDTIGPLYCLLSADAMDYMSRPLCNEQGIYINRTPDQP
jgi:hypothetical protein